ELLPGNLLRKPRIVLDVRREHELPARDQPARIEPFDAKGRQVRPRGIDGRGEPGRAGTDDDDFMTTGLGHDGTVILYSPVCAQRLRAKSLQKAVCDGAAGRDAAGQG